MQSINQSVTQAVAQSPKFSRVNSEKSNVMALRPMPPSSPPPLPPSCVANNEACIDSVKDAFSSLSPKPSSPSDDDRSTRLGSSISGESESDNEQFPNEQACHPWKRDRMRTPITPFSPLPEMSVTRDTMLYHRALVLKNTAPGSIKGKGLHSRIVNNECSPVLTPVVTAQAPPGLSAPVAAPVVSAPAPPGLSAPKKAAWKAPGMTGPPGMGAQPPPGLMEPVRKPPSGFAPPPGLELASKALAKAVYSPQAFRKEMMAIFKELAVDHNVAKAVRRVRMQGVPRERQASEMADAVTYVLEESRGAARRSFVAFAAGIAAAFDKDECAKGLEIFFRTVYPDLQEEVPKLAKIVNVELVPTLQSVFSAKELRSFLPSELTSTLA